MPDMIKGLLLLLLFSPLLVFAVRHKKWYLYLACGLVGILPDPFAIELSASLPLLTVERMLILAFFGCWIYKKARDTRRLSGGFGGFVRQFAVPLSLVIYFAVNLAISVVNFRFGIANEVKHIAILLLEQFLLVVMIADTIEDRAELDRCIDAMLLAWAAMCVIGILQTVVEFDLTTVLELTAPRVDGGLTQRMDMIRAFGTSNAISYGCYCAFMALVIYYRLERTGRQRYSLLMAANVAAMMCTLSRSAWLCFLAAFGVLFLMRPVKLMRRIWPSVAACALLCVVLCVVNTGLGNAILETTKSSINTVLEIVDISPLPDTTGDSSLSSPSAPVESAPVESDPTESAPTESTPTESAPVESDPISKPPKEPPRFEVSEDFGLNEKTATSSRLVQWTAVDYMMDEGYGLCGYGYRAQLRGKLHYLYPELGYWISASYVDVGLIAVATESGLLGLTAFVGLLVLVAVAAWRRRGAKGTMTFNKLSLYMIGLLLLLNFAAAFSEPLWVFMGLFYAGLRLERKGLPEDGTPAEIGWRF